MIRGALIIFVGVFFLINILKYRKNIYLCSRFQRVGSIDIKFDEQAIIDLSNELNVEFEIISSDEIRKIENLFDKSEFVKKQVGVYNVSEPVAYILSNKNILVKKTKYKGITISMGRIKK